jgi:pimeloyl-ACP methyl ester carboxylesterase
LGAARRAIAQAIRFPLYKQVGFDRRSASWHTPQEIAAARIDALLTYDAGERSRSIRNPTLLIAAADDLLVPWQLSELIAEEIAHACSPSSTMAVIAFRRHGSKPTTHCCLSSSVPMPSETFQARGESNADPIAQCKVD